MHGDQAAIESASPGTSLPKRNGGSVAIAGGLSIATPVAAASAQGIRVQRGSRRGINDSIVKPERGPKAMTDKRVAIYDTYLSAWSAIPDEERRRLLRESVTEDVVFRNPMQTRAGLDDVVKHLEGFQQRSPNGSFVSVAMLGWENNALATWQFVDAEGERGFTGFDVLHFDGKGHIASILLFGNVEKQTLK
jgi:hypothetical protein